MQHQNPSSSGDAIKERAAQYVRMSTDEQDYSPFNQEKAIAAYALAHNIMVVRKYADEGRSGLNLDSRPGFKEMLRDVQAGQTHYSIILVYDVSRWGRFQDVDEGAYYEQICKKAGVRVIFCAEDFKDDGSLASTLLKAMDRVEAAKYSLRLSTRVFAGQCNLGSRGFWQGAPAGYGLRRALFDASGSPRTILAAGERKFIQSDRVILHPGPADEVEIVRRIFRSFALDGKGEIAIAKELNDEGRVNQFGRPWSRGTISHILSNEKYMGNNIYNRTSHKLKGKCVKNPPEMWIRSANAFEAVVDPILFDAVQRKMGELTYRKSNQRMLDDLRSLLASKGRLTSKLIDDAELLPCSGSYHQRFGSLLKAYELIGYQPKIKVAAIAARLEARTKRRRILSDIFADLERSGLDVRFDWGKRAYVVNSKLTVAIYLLRRLRGKRGPPQWTIRQRRKSNTKLVIGVRTDAANDSVHDYLLLRPAGLSARLRNSDVNVEDLGATSIETIADLTRTLRDATTAA
ncbi:recombinase family protein [Bradyrhizobium sp. AUGA SZCCT0160]|uniref:recombinase family protein n=1 Tax=Bradyrhizobium sp. AUGA SZCCT0160 TaxID=2807662 RepID=UPI001BAC5A21|nr:recombinase family protein [Bradyrhizobium sp. AUGA SZCCT0160]MBR1187270.1 recombinase family protein [Bradyrhizobium sp. AUGA SZCCT0160]